jgi:hypothetical protein
MNLAHSVQDLRLRVALDSQDWADDNRVRARWSLMGGPRRCLPVGVPTLSDMWSVGQLAGSDGFAQCGDCWRTQAHDFAGLETPKIQIPGNDQ